MCLRWPGMAHRGAQSGSLSAVVCRTKHHRPTTPDSATVHRPMRSALARLPPPPPPPPPPPHRAVSRCDLDAGASRSYALLCSAADAVPASAIDDACRLLPQQAPAAETANSTNGPEITTASVAR